MPTLKEALKKLNKDVAVQDQFRIASDVPTEDFDVHFTSFGSPMMDYKANGVGLGRMTLFVGWQGSGKTTFALLAAAQLQRETGKYVAYFDGEYTIDNSYLDRMGINRELFIYRQGSNLEDMLDEAEELSKVDEIGMIVIDSVKSFTSKIVEDKSAEQDTIGVEAKKLNARMGVINGNTSRRKIALLVLNQLRVNPGQMFGNPETKPGGHWQDFFPSLELHFTKKNLIKDNSGETIGHTTDVRIKKSKYRGYDPKDTFTCNLYYDYGFNQYDEYAELLVEKEIIEKRGGWYYFPNGEKAQGINKVSYFLESNPEYLDELIKLIDNKDTKDGDVNTSGTGKGTGNDISGVQEAKG